MLMKPVPLHILLGVIIVLFVLYLVEFLMWITYLLIKVIDKHKLSLSVLKAQSYHTVLRHKSFLPALNVLYHKARLIHIFQHANETPLDCLIRLLYLLIVKAYVQIAFR